MKKFIFALGFTTLGIGIGLYEVAEVLCTSKDNYESGKLSDEAKKHYEDFIELLIPKKYDTFKNFAKRKQIPLAKSLENAEKKSSKTEDSEEKNDYDSYIARIDEVVSKMYLGDGE